MEMTELLPATGLGGLIVAVAFFIVQFVRARHEAKITDEDVDAAILKNAGQANAILNDVLRAVESDREAQRLETARLKERTTELETQLIQTSAALDTEKKARAADRAEHDKQISALRQELEELRQNAMSLKKQLEASNDS